MLQLILSDTSIPHIGVLMVDILVRQARAWKLTFTTTNSHNAKTLTTDRAVTKKKKKYV